MVKVSISTVGRVLAHLKVRGMVIEPDRQPAPLWIGATAKELLDRLVDRMKLAVKSIRVDGASG